MSLAPAPPGHLYNSFVSKGGSGTGGPAATTLPGSRGHQRPVHRAPAAPPGFPMQHQQHGIPQHASHSTGGKGGRGPNAGSSAGRNPNTRMGGGAGGRNNRGGVGIEIFPKCLGCIRMFNPMKGWGFIQLSPDTVAAAEKAGIREMINLGDIFLHQKHYMHTAEIPVAFVGHANPQGQGANHTHGGLIWLQFDLKISSSKPEALAVCRLTNEEFAAARLSQSFVPRKGAADGQDPQADGPPQQQHQHQHPGQHQYPHQQQGQHHAGGSLLSSLLGPPGTPAAPPEGGASDVSKHPVIAAAARRIQGGLSQQDDGQIRSDGNSPAASSGGGAGANNVSPPAGNTAQSQHTTTSNYTLTSNYTFTTASSGSVRGGTITGEHDESSARANMLIPGFSYEQDQGSLYTSFGGPMGGSGDHELDRSSMSPTDVAMGASAAPALVDGMVQLPGPGFFLREASTGPGAGAVREKSGAVAAARGSGLLARTGVEGEHTSSSSSKSRASNSADQVSFGHRSSGSSSRIAGANSASSSRRISSSEQRISSERSPNLDETVRGRAPTTSSHDIESSNGSAGSLGFRRVTKEVSFAGEQVPANYTYPHAPPPPGMYTPGEQHRQAPANVPIVYGPPPGVVLYPEHHGQLQHHHSATFHHPHSLRGAHPPQLEFLNSHPGTRTSIPQHTMADFLRRNASAEIQTPRNAQYNVLQRVSYQQYESEVSNALFSEEPPEDALTASSPFPRKRNTYHPQTRHDRRIQKTMGGIYYNDTWSESWTDMSGATMNSTVGGGSTVHGGGSTNRGSIYSAFDGNNNSNFSDNSLNLAGTAALQRRRHPTTAAAGTAARGMNNSGHLVPAPHQATSILTAPGAGAHSPRAPANQKYQGGDPRGRSRIKETLRSGGRNRNHSAPGGNTPGEASNAPNSMITMGFHYVQHGAGAAGTAGPHAPAGTSPHSVERQRRIQQADDLAEQQKHYDQIIGGMRTMDGGAGGTSTLKHHPMLVSQQPPSKHSSPAFGGGAKAFAGDTETTVGQGSLPSSSCSSMGGPPSSEHQPRPSGSRMKLPAALVMQQTPSRGVVPAADACPSPRFMTPDRTPTAPATPVTNKASTTMSVTPKGSSFSGRIPSPVVLRNPDSSARDCLRDPPPPLDSVPSTNSSTPSKSAPSKSGGENGANLIRSMLTDHSSSTAPENNRAPAREDVALLHNTGSIGSIGSVGTCMSVRSSVSQQGESAQPSSRSSRSLIPQSSRSSDNGSRSSQRDLLESSCSFFSQPLHETLHASLSEENRPSFREEFLSADPRPSNMWGKDLEVDVGAGGGCEKGGGGGGGAGKVVSAKKEAKKK